MAASDGGHVWPSRSSDLRIQELTGAGPEGSTPDHVFAALVAAGYVGSIDDMWMQHKIALGITDTSEPFADSIAVGGGGGGGAEGSEIDLFETEPTAGNYILTVPTVGHGFWMNAAGTRVYHASDTGDKFVAMTLSTPYDLSSGSYDANETGDLVRPFVLWVSEAEDKIWYPVAGYVYQRTVGTPGDLSTIGGVDSSLEITGLVSGQGMHFNPDGTKLYVAGATKIVVEVTLSTGFDLTSGSITDSLDISVELTGAGAGYGITFDPAGTKMYVADFTNHEIAQYNLSTAYDLTTAVYSKKITLTGSAQNPHELFMHPDGDGTIMYGASQAGGDRLWMLELA